MTLEKLLVEQLHDLSSRLRSRFSLTFERDALTTDKAAAEVIRLQDALRFYAEAGECPHSEGREPVCIWDDGNIAKAALAAQPEDEHAL